MIQKDFFDSIGQSRQFDRAPITSGLPRLADNFSAGRDFSFGPTTDVAALALRNDPLNRGVTRDIMMRSLC
jgi:hypothetical protein